MKSLDEMVLWNYKKAREYFSLNNIEQHLPEARHYVFSLSNAETVDLRHLDNAKESILSTISLPKSFIFIDGPSCNGKSTLAQRIAKNIDAEIIDIDLLCNSWLEKKMDNAKNPFQKFSIILNFDLLTDEYLLNNLENVVQQKSNLGKTVILVGVYINIIYRSIIVRTLGHYFNNKISLMCSETSFSDVEKLYASRFNKPYEDKLNTFTNIKLQYYQAQQMILSGKDSPLGLGMNYSFIVNSHISNMLLP